MNIPIKQQLEELEKKAQPITDKVIATLELNFDSEEDKYTFGFYTMMKHNIDSEEGKKNKMLVRAESELSNKAFIRLLEESSKLVGELNVQARFNGFNEFKSLNFDSNYIKSHKRMLKYFGYQPPGTPGSGFDRTWKKHWM